MFNISAITDEISQDFEHALDVMLEYDVRLVEIRGLWNTNISVLDPDGLKAAKEAIAKRGMSVIGIGSPAFKCLLPKTSEEADKQVELFRHCCDVAHFFETEMVRVFAFYPEKGNLPVPTPEIWETIKNQFSSAVEIAEKEQLVIGLENEHGCFVGTGAESAELFRKVPSRHLQAVWDPGNAFFAHEVPFPDGYNAVRGQIVHVHMKDAIHDPVTGRDRWLPIGEGEIDFRGQLQALKEDGYRGALSLETHYVPEGGTPEDGSRTSLENLLNMLKTEVA